MKFHSSLMLVKLCSKSCMLGFSIMGSDNVEMSKLGLEKAEEPEVKLSTFAGSLRRQGNSRKISTSVSLTIIKLLTLWIITNYGKCLRRWKYQTILPVSWETYMLVKKQELKPWMEQLTGLGLRKEFNKAVYSHPVYLTSWESSWEMPGWMSHKLGSRLPGETSTTSDRWMIPL